MVERARRNAEKKLRPAGLGAPIETLEPESTDDLEPATDEGEPEG